MCELTTLTLSPPYCRCQTEPCESCSHQGKTHKIGERWRSRECQVCQPFALNVVSQCQRNKGLTVLRSSYT
uniref:Uncharacterized protein n=1 Tax=Leptobrachium leishanense TaxID=445787 RepID=A0A8C5W755_9ANUR